MNPLIGTSSERSFLVSAFEKLPPTRGLLFRIDLINSEALHL